VRMRVLSGIHRLLYRASGGRLGGRIVGLPVLLLTTTGRRSGSRRTVPLAYLEDGGRLVLVASCGGSPRHPAWFLNLEASPDVEVRIGAGRKPMRARRATPEERARLWPQVVAAYHGYERYQQRTDREIPLVILSPGELA